MDSGLILLKKCVPHDNDTVQLLFRQFPFFYGSQRVLLVQMYGNSSQRLETHLEDVLSYQKDINFVLERTVE